MTTIDRYAFWLGMIIVILATLAGLFVIFYSRWRLYQPITLTPKIAERLTERLAGLNLPTLGGEDRVAVVAFFSYTCPACQKHTEKYERMLVRNLMERGWGYMLVPLTVDPRAVRPSALALCTWEQAPERFENLHKTLFSGKTSPSLPADIENCAGSDEVEKKFEEIQKAALNAGVVGTPSFYLVDLHQTITGVQDEKHWQTWLAKMEASQKR